MKAKERELLTYFRELDAQHQESLLSYAEFLREKLKDRAPEQHIQLPLEIEASETETVVGAIKRLSKSYFMLESTDLLNRASSLMSQHVMQGRAALDVIAELEEMFAEHYRAYRASFTITMKKEK